MSLKSAQPAKPSSAAALAEIPVGAVVDGRVRRVEEFGVFVEVGCTSIYVLSTLRWPSATSQNRHLKARCCMWHSELCQICSSQVRLELAPAIPREHHQDSSPQKIPFLQTPCEDVFSHGAGGRQGRPLWAGAHQRAVRRLCGRHPRRVPGRPGCAFKHS